MSDISMAGKCLSQLASQLDHAELRVKEALQAYFCAQDTLRNRIMDRDAIQHTLNLTAQFVARETK